MVSMGKEDFSVEILDGRSVERVLTFYASTGFPYKPESEAKLREGLETGAWIFVMAVQNSCDVGGFYLNTAPKYHVYRSLKIPELQDLRVLSGHRRQGIASALIAKGEELARQKGAKGLGISVGLYADYGAAQRLYFKLGYEPDGNGITYDREPVAPGDRRPVDDDLALMLLKSFN